MDSTSADGGLFTTIKQNPELVQKGVDRLKEDGVIDTYQAVRSTVKSEEGLTTMGYSSAGEVIEVGDEVNGLEVGDRVACSGAGYACHANVVSVPENLTTVIPDDVSTEDASFVTVGSIAMQGVRTASLSPGERVAVIGLGLVGQLVIRILNAYGFRTLGIDIDQQKVKKGLEGGMDYGAIVDEDVERTVANMTGGSGVDAAIIAATTERNDPIELAAEILRKRGTVSVIGRVGLEIPRYEFRHKELDFRISNSYGPGRYDRRYEEKGVDYPLAYVRWTENRNMGEFLRLLEDDLLELDPIKTHHFSIENALQAYERINDDKETIGVLLEYEKGDRSRTISLVDNPKNGVRPNHVSVGIIGAGNFASRTLLPILDEMENATVRAVATASSSSAIESADKYGCQYCTTDYREIIDDEDVDMVVISTRDGMHAEMAAEVLRAGKHVHVEKPLATDREGLKEVVDAWQASDGKLMVGFNRRFSPAADELMDSFGDVDAPILMNYRINAGYREPDHWSNDPDEGAGRIVGEVCHFVDLCQYVSDSLPVCTYADALPPEGDIVANDNINALVEFDDGSSASITYAAMGDDSVEKEYFEAIGDDKFETIDNYTIGRFDQAQDKGHRTQFEQFLDAIRNGRQTPIPLQESVATTLTTFAILESIRSGSEVPISSSEFLNEDKD